MWSLVLLSILCIYVWLLRELSKNPDSSGHHLHCSMSLILTSYYSLAALDPCLRADWEALHPGLESLTLYFGVLLLTWPMFFILSSGPTGSHGHSSLYGLHTKIDKGRSRHSCAASMIPTIIPPATHNSHRPAHTHPYIYTHTHTHTHTHTKAHYHATYVHTSNWRLNKLNC